MFTRWVAAWSLIAALPAFTHPVKTPPPIGINATAPYFASNEGYFARDIFYIGGIYQTTGNNTILVDYTYVEKISPKKANQSFPIVFIHGQGPTGANWLNTPDNRKGWASYFAGKGYEVYIVDIPGVGRSSQNDFADYPEMVGSTVEQTEAAFTAPEKFMMYPQAAKHTQWPGTGLRGDPIFDAFYPTLIPAPTNRTRLQYAMQAVGCQLLQKIGKSFLLAHSAGTIYPYVMADLCPDLIQGTIDIEPYNTPFQVYVPPMPTADAWGLSDIPVMYDPPVKDPATDLVKKTVGVTTPERYACILQDKPVKKLVNISKVPVLVVLSEASIHQGWDYCVVDYMRQAGVPVQFTQLADIGIYGNGHFMFLEKNNLVIAGVVEQWMKNPTGTTS